MKCHIIGSGGCKCIPRPTCGCRVCKEARGKGVPYARCGCSMYIEDIHVLIDTPEDSAVAINNAKIEEINTILYTHSDPDHTLGMRVIEQLRMDWLSYSIGKRCQNPITIMGLPTVIDEVSEIRFSKGPFMEYYEKMGLIQRKKIEKECTIGTIKISFIPVDEKEEVTIFVLQENEKKIIYAPCDITPFPDNNLFYGADYLIIGNTIMGEVLKDGFILEKDNPLRKELFTLEQIGQIKKRYAIKEVIMTHIEEDWGKSYEEYEELERQLDNGITFAFDGMKIEI